MPGSFQRTTSEYCNGRRLMVRHGFVPLLVHMLETSSREDAVLHAAFMRRAASTILARLANRCGAALLSSGAAAALSPPNPLVSKHGHFQTLLLRCGAACGDIVRKPAACDDHTCSQKLEPNNKVCRHCIRRRPV